MINAAPSGVEATLGSSKRALIMKNILSIAALATLVAGAADATTNYVQNGGFESPAPGTGPLQSFGYGASNEADWAFYGYAGNLHATYNSTANLFNYPLSFPAHGHFVYYDAGPGYSSGSLYQTVSGLTPGQKYTVSFLEAFAVENQGTTGDTAQWAVTLGGTPAANGFTSGDTQLGPNVTIDGINGNPWQEVSVRFTADSPSEILSFRGVGTGFPPFALIDNVAMTVGVPEPATWTMMILGLGGLGALARRRRAAALAT
jgi:hypothetical protein